MTSIAGPLSPLPQHIDATERVCFVQCPQKFYREFCEGRRPSGLSVDLHAGGCFSVAVEEVYKQFCAGNTDPEIYLGHALLRYTQEWGDFPKLAEHMPKKTVKTFERVWAAVEDYFRTYNPETDHVQPHRNALGEPSVEFTFAIPLDDPIFPRHPSGEPFIYCGRFDLLGRIESLGGAIAPLDNKTTGRTPSNFSEQWDLRSQFIGYVWACRTLGLDCRYLVARGTVILTKEIRQLEVVKPYSDHLIDLWYHQLARDLHRMVNCWNAGYFDYDLGEACTAYGMCIFAEACQSPTPDAWLNNFEVRHWNPLHRDPSKTEAA